jgi:hypothetical protein
MQVGAALAAEFEIIVDLRTASRTKHENSSLSVIASADVISSRLINATFRDTKKLEVLEPFSDGGFPKTDIPAAISTADAAADADFSMS